MAVIECTAPAYASEAEMRESYVERRERLWPSRYTNIVRRGVLIPYLSDDEYAMTMHPPEFTIVPKVLEYAGGSRPLIVCSVVARFYGLTLAELRGKRRKKEMVIARWVVMYILSRRLGLSLPSVGRHLGNKDHTTCIHGLRQMEKKMDADSVFAGTVYSLMRACEL